MCMCACGVRVARPGNGRQHLRHYNCDRDGEQVRSRVWGGHLSGRGGSISVSFTLRISYRTHKHTIGPSFGGCRNDTRYVCTYIGANTHVRSVFLQLLEQSYGSTHVG